MINNIIVAQTKVRIGTYLDENKYEILSVNSGYTLFFGEHFIGIFTGAILEGKYDQRTSTINFQYTNNVSDKMYDYKYYEPIIPIFEFDTKFKGSKKVEEFKIPATYMLECSNRIGVAMSVEFKTVENEFSKKERVYREFIQSMKSI